MLNLNGLTAIEQVVLVIAALLVAWVAFKILAGLLRIVLIVAIVASLWVFVLQPTLMHDDSGGQVAKLSPEAQYAVAEFSRCLNETLATVGTGQVSECKQRVIGVLQQSRGAEYAAEASRAIEAALNKSRQTTM